MKPPPNDVLEAFGVDGEPQPLAGGTGTAFRVGGAVLKPVDDAAETAWVHTLLTRLQPEGFGVAQPLATGNGGWVHDGWAATAFVDGLRPAAPDWDAIIDAGLRFADAAEHVRDGGEEVLSARTHRWAVADRVAWGEHEVDLDAAAADVLDRLVKWTSAPPSAERHFVHGDLSGNVFVDARNVPVILDVSPYLRPREWAAAIVIVDAVLWNGADVALARDYGNRDLFARALVFRMVAEQLADDPRHGALLAPYRNLLEALA